MPIAVRGVISYTLTDAELETGRALRRNRENDTGEEPSWPSAQWDYTEMEEFDYEIRNKFGIPTWPSTPITNFMELFKDEDEYFHADGAWKNYDGIETR